MKENITQVKSGIKAKVLAILSNENNVKDYEVVIRVMRNYDINITDISIEYPYISEMPVKIMFKCYELTTRVNFSIPKHPLTTFEEFLSSICLGIYMQCDFKKANTHKIKAEEVKVSLKAKSKISIIKYKRK